MGNSSSDLSSEGSSNSDNISQNDVEEQNENSIVKDEINATQDNESNNEVRNNLNDKVDELNNDEEANEEINSILEKNNVETKIERNTESDEYKIVRSPSPASTIGRLRYDSNDDDDSFLLASEYQINMPFNKYGWKPDIPDYRDEFHNFHPLLEVDSERYTTVDLRNKMPPVYEQGKLGSCTANALAAAFYYNELLQNTSSSDLISPSRLFIYYNERLVQGTVDSDSGSSLRIGIKSIHNKGVCSENEWPYDISKFAEEPLEKCYENALEHRSLTYKRLKQNLTQLQRCLQCGLPFVFGFTVFNSFESEAVAESGIMNMPSQNESLLGGHAVLAVGYDDNKEHFIVRNSWGSQWGDNGYFYMPYNYILNKKLATDFWTIQKITEDRF